MNTRIETIIDLRSQRMTCKEIGAVLGISKQMVNRSLISNGITGRLPKLPKQIKPTKEELFWSRVDKSNPDGCWLWKFSKTKAGYGRMRLDIAGNYAHRAAWIFTYGPIPDGLQVCHKCDNPPCCNPDHLFLGTQKDNNHDRDAKGRDRWHYFSGRRRTRKQCSEVGCDRMAAAKGLCNMHYKRWLRATGRIKRGQ